MSTAGAEAATASTIDQTATLEPQSHSHTERTDFAGEPSDVKQSSDSSNSEEPTQRPDEHRCSINQDGAQQAGAETSKEQEKEDGVLQSDTLRIEKEDEDPMSEGTDIYDEDTTWRHGFANDKNLDERRKKAPKRIRQYADYIKLMEDRMTVMEEQLRKINIDTTKPSQPVAETPAADDHPSPQTKQLQLSIAHVKWDEFNRVGSSGKHVIDVLIGDPDYMQSRKQKKAAKIEDKKKTTDENEKKAGYEERKEETEGTQPRFASAGEKRSLLPERMCINSDLLLGILSEITSLTMKGPLIIIRPFKVLITWEEEIRQRLSLLESKWEELDALAGKEKERAAAEAKVQETELEKVENTELPGPREEKDGKEDGNIGEPNTKTPTTVIHPNRTLAQTPASENLGKADSTKNAKNSQPILKGPEQSDYPSIQQVEEKLIEPGQISVNQAVDHSKDQTSDPTKEDPNDKAPQILERSSVTASAQSTQETATDFSKQQAASQNEVYDDIDEDIRSTDGKAALKRLRLLVKFMDEEVIGPLAKLKEAHRHQQIFFADLFHFFIPGDEVYRFHGSGANEQVQAYRVLQVVGGRRFNFSEKPTDGTESFELLSPNEVGSPFVITCIHIDFDGKELGPITTTFTIKEYTGERSTASLPVCPPAFMKDPKDLRRDLELRGQRFIELAQVSHKEYTGLTLDPIEDIDSQVIVDFDTTFQVNRSWAPNLDIQYPAAADPRETAPLPANYEDTYEAKGTVLDSYEHEYSYMHEDSSVDQIRMKDFMEDHPIFRRDPPVLLKATKHGVELNAEDKRLLPGRVFGFVLRSRTWAALSIRLVKDLPVKQDGFDQLVLPHGHKDLVRALVKTHSRGARPASGPVEEIDHQVDLVKGKGKGLIICAKAFISPWTMCAYNLTVLHGVPGVGKTSTAECIADYTQRPLFPITCGDIGETATSVEANLGKSFQLAHQWGCVLLLDEADVFMAKRSGSDIQRNSLVSVFLRILEYYSGILFLTTNRVGIFDPAFKSRIHISLYYPPLDGGTTIQIWKVNIDRTRTSENKYEVDEDRILEFAKRHFREHDEGGRWNGRQIRNAFQTAIALAEYDATEYMRRRFNVSDTRELPTLKPRITVDHFQKVANAASDFDRYLKDVYGGRDEAERAFGESLRKDDWGQQAVATMRPPMRDGHNSRVYYQQAQYRQQQQQQRFQGRDMFHSEPSFEEMDPFQESKYPVLPNEADSFNRRPSPDHRSVTRPDRGRYDELSGPLGGLGSSNTPSPWSVSGGSAHAGRMQTPQNGRPRTMGTAHYEESEYKMPMTNNFSEFDETDPRNAYGHRRESQGRASAY
ncbi:MAG: hypothetical protein Q9209_000046 [Squamulea sp. 1 TL-2023]